MSNILNQTIVLARRPGHMGKPRVVGQAGEHPQSRLGGMLTVPRASRKAGNCR